MNLGSNFCPISTKNKEIPISQEISILSSHSHYGDVFDKAKIRDTSFRPKEYAGTKKKQLCFKAASVGVGKGRPIFDTLKVIFKVKRKKWSKNFLPGENPSNSE